MKTGNHIFHPTRLGYAIAVVFMEFLRCLCFPQTASRLFKPLIPETATTNTVWDTSVSNIYKQHTQMKYYVLLLIHQKFSISKAGKKLKSYAVLCVMIPCP